ncbi:capsular exopolysaccharide biosynthesis protein [Leptolyngbya sp. Heron Island J]|uniref:GumC family protein n=1 Tax=Leptolyngbya sp. Heron Island J TaxID=1385935 RepID=UPI0003B9F551|nr:polysaccharide biosynthesis tyrosine autokinase [Leptolyngbya sp. Heron Island J]ESA38921.1 capsular exopolysaccharide biosynthesis protein [Leptolyngbya sp. Heron Island J]
MDNLASANGASANSLVKASQLPQMPWANDDDELDLAQLLTVLRRRSLMITGVAAGVMGTVMFNTLRQEPVYEGSFEVLVEPVNADDNFTDLSGLLAEAAPVKQSGLDYETQVQVLRSPELIDQVIAELKTIDPDLDYETLLKNLTIKRVGETKIIEVSYKGTDPVEIQATLDALSTVYLKYSLDERQTNLRQGIQFVDRQLPELQTRVDELQSQLERFRQAYNFIDPTTQNQQINVQAQQLSTQRLEIDRQLAQAITNYELLQSQGGSEVALQSAPVYQQLIQELRQVETEIATELTRFQPGSLAIQVLQEKRDRMLPVIDAEAQRVLNAKYAEAENAIELLATQNDTIAAAEAQLQSTLTQLPTLAREYSDLQRELEIAVGALSRFLETREQLQIEAAQTEIPWELIEAPTQPEKPISPNPRRSFVLGLVASLLVSVGAALLLEKMDTVCRTVEELERVVKLPLLGTVPYQSDFDTEQKQSNGVGQWLQQRLSKKSTSATDGYYGYSGSQFLESMRLLQTNLSLTGADRAIRSVIISSAMPNEGKSTIARHLAQTAATMGKRVLLVDADLRRPTVHHRLGLTNDKGLSDLLSGNATGNEVLQKAMPFVDFYAITAGTAPPDPVKLLASKRMRLLMNQLDKQFDLVVYDTPPLVGLADATLIAANTDGLILVSRLNKCDRNILQHAMDNISFTKVPVLGLVANGVSPSSNGYKYYSYGGYGSQSEPPNPTPDTADETAKVLTAAASTNGSSPDKNSLSISDFLKLGK